MVGILMKVYIGPYKNWVGPYQLLDMLFFWQEKYPLDEAIEERWDYKLKDRLGDWLASTWVNKFCNWIHSKKKRKEVVKLHHYDTWGTDHTISIITLPLLKQLRDTKHGSPNVDDEDVPEELKSTSAPKPKHDYDIDDNHHKRWDWVLNEMIWAFEQKLDDKAEDQFHSGDHDIHWQKVDQEYNPVGEPKPLGERDPLFEEEKGKFYWTMVHGPNDTHVFDREGWEKWNARKRNGFKLFGKYFEALWD